MAEFWKDIEGFFNYEVSTEGRVRNKDTGKFLKPRSNGHGSLLVNLYKGGAIFSKQLRRLVADAFLEVPDFDIDSLDVVVRHMDGDYENCSAVNLVWDIRYNVQWRIRNPLTDRPVRIVETGEVFDDVVACAQRIEGSDVMIERAILDDELSYKGYHFEWV